MATAIYELDAMRIRIENRMTSEELDETFERAGALAEELSAFVFDCPHAFWRKPKKILRCNYEDRAVVARAIDGNWYPAADVSLDLLDDELEEWALNVVDSIFDARRKAKRAKKPLPESFGTIDKKVMNPSGGFMFSCLDGKGGALYQIMILPKSRYDCISVETKNAAEREK